MKNIKVLLFILITNICFAQKEFPIIKATSKKVDIRDGENFKRASWTISPQINPDVYSTSSLNKKVIFYTDLDSISICIKKNTKFNFIIELNDSIKAYTQIKYILPKVKYSKEYVTLNKGKFAVFSPKVHELVNIALALTKIGKKDHNMIANTTEYYQKVITYFDQYKHHPLIDSLNVKMIQNTYNYYYNLKMNACMYSFNKKHKIENKSPYRRLGWNTNFLEELIPLLENFAKTTNFHNFYKQNTNYYQSLINDYYKTTPIDKMWRWLEDRSPKHYDSYKIYFSPLVGGAHSTERFTDNGFNETVMFINAPIFPKEYTITDKEYYSSLAVFTEIDHNYVNPISEMFSNEIKKSFSNRFYWVLDDPGLNGYSTPYKVYNEYMTWAVYSLYCTDIFSNVDADKYIKNIEDIMVRRRGFIKFKEFNQKLIEIYKNKKSVKMTSLTKTILNWSKEEQK